MVFMSRRFHNLFDMDRVSQVVDVLLVGSDIENRSQRFRQLHRENFLLRTELDRRVNATGVACIVASVRAVEDHLQLGFVVVSDSDGDINVRHVTVVQSAECKISMQELRVDVELEMLVAEAEAAERQDHRLDDAAGASADQIVTALLLQRQHPGLHDEVGLAEGLHVFPQAANLKFIQKFNFSEPVDSLFGLQRVVVVEATFGIRQVMCDLVLSLRRYRFFELVRPVVRENLINCRVDFIACRVYRVKATTKFPISKDPTHHLKRFPPWTARCRSRFATKCSRFSCAVA